MNCLHTGELSTSEDYVSEETKRLLERIISTQMSDEYPLDEETKLKFHDILTKLSNDDPNFFKIFSKTELKTLESVLSEEVCVSFC